ncbi:MAG: YraN family protein [Alphaproteobacteria bacterium GM202ARS2]|nr:YraN family protein [Alphaproteobacteria bacterium GM202ARS2]
MKPAPTPNKRIGILGEHLCALFLRLKGYTVLARNWTCRYGELDIVAKRRSTLVFVEVKTRRSSHILRTDIISPAQKQRIIHTSQLFLSRYPQFRTFFIRFDVIVLTGLYPTHIRNIWQESMPS